MTDTTADLRLRDRLHFAALVLNYAESNGVYISVALKAMQREHIELALRTHFDTENAFRVFLSRHKAKYIHDDSDEIRAMFTARRVNSKDARTHGVAVMSREAHTKDVAARDHEDIERSVSVMREAIIRDPASPFLTQVLRHYVASLGK